MQAKVIRDYPRDGETQISPGIRSPAIFSAKFPFGFTPLYMERFAANRNRRNCIAMGSRNRWRLLGLLIVGGCGASAPEPAGFLLGTAGLATRAGYRRFSRQR